jgi:hypothetical protein
MNRLFLTVSLGGLPPCRYNVLHSFWNMPFIFSHVSGRTPYSILIQRFLRPVVSFPSHAFRISFQGLLNKSNVAKIILSHISRRSAPSLAREIYSLNWGTPSAQIYYIIMLSCFTAHTYYFLIIRTCSS